MRTLRATTRADRCRYLPPHARAGSSPAWIPIDTDFPQTEAIGKAREAAQLALEQQSPAAKLELAAEAERKEDEAAEAVAAARATV